MKVKYPILGDKDWLTNEIQSKPLRQIASEIGSSYGAVIWTIRKYGIKVPQRFKKRRSLTLSASCKRAYREKWPEGRFGSLASNWKGGRRRGGNKGRYVLIYRPTHPNCDNEGYVMEHRLVIEETLGRLLKDGEIVHHKNGIPTDNDIDNLELVDRKSHAKIHFDAVKENVRLKHLLDEHNIPY